MRDSNILVLLVLCLSFLFSSGCKSSGSKPSNPFAQNHTVPPPSTFSSQESYLGQTPGAYTPQTPATTYPGAGSVPPTQPVTTTPANGPVSSTDANVNNQEASLFASAKKDVDWQPVDVISTSHTAFQAMEAKSSSGSDSSDTTDMTTRVPESVIVGTSHVVTTISDESKPPPALSEPQLLYSGNYKE